MRLEDMDLARIKSFQDTLDPMAWSEDRNDDTIRRQVRPDTDLHILRHLFPVSCRVTGRSVAYDLKGGEILRFARTRLIPAFFPVQAVQWNAMGATCIRMFTHDEVEVLPPVDGDA